MINIDTPVDDYHPLNSGYTPKAGDIVVFGTPQGIEGYRSGHIGIVVAYDENTETVYTVEGNSGDKVQAVSYQEKNTYITGYYSTGGTSYGDAKNITDNYKVAAGTEGRKK